MELSENKLQCVWESMSMKELISFFKYVQLCGKEEKDKHNSLDLFMRLVDKQKIKLRTSPNLDFKCESWIEFVEW